MNSHLFQLNLFSAWTGILLGLTSGMIIGLYFHREGWLGGYDSLKRRMYRLAHISLFGLGAVNLMFYLTTRVCDLNGNLLEIAAWSFLVGAVSMPVCCVIMAHTPRLHIIFAVPVISLLVGATLTLVSLPGGLSAAPVNPQLSNINTP